MLRKRQENGKRSRLRRPKNGVPRGSVLAPLLINIYSSDLPTTISRKYAYADDLAIMHADRDWLAVEGALSKDMATPGEYLLTWKLKLSTTYNGVGSLPSQQQGSQTWGESQLQQRNPALVLWAQIPRSNVGQVPHVPPTPWVTSQEANITRRIPEAVAGSGWGAGVTTLRTATLALVHSTAEYCAPVWCCSAHARLIDPTINDALRIVTGCLHPTPADNLPILAGIQPAELRRTGATLSLGRRAMEPGHLLHSALTRPSSAVARRLKSRHPFVPAIQQLLLVQMDMASTADVSMAHKNKPSTMSSSNVQSIDLPTDCTPWRSWTMRQPNSCSTPAPKSSTAKKWMKDELAQTKEEDES